MKISSKDLKLYNQMKFMKCNKNIELIKNL